MRKGQGSIVIVGAGINGLVASNYLQRGGYRVTLLERKAEVGGACTAETTRYRGATITYPPGASVLGMMQRFVFKETGLADKVDIRSPRCPEIVYFAGEEPFLVPDNDGDLAAEVKARWGENGRVVAFLEDLEHVAAFL